MTFLEAAIEILRRAEGSMHFSDIAKQAVSEKLLSHVGRDPEAAMRSCLTSAVRGGRDGESPLVIREKPGYYAIAPGAELPEPVEPPKSKASTGGSKKKSKSKGSPRKREAAEAEAPAVEEPDEEPKPEAPQVGAVAPELEFEAPSGSGLEGVTDVAIVMANAMSRLVEERPELRDELEAMQQDANPKPEPAAPKVSRTVRAGRGSRQEITVEERPSRRRRRRRRRGKRVEWSQPGADAASSPGDVTDKLLDGAADVLQEAGARSLHVRQIAETLAGRGVLGGEISEIERAVTAAILMDVQTRGRASRFVARGDARYQLHGTRIPQAAAKAEETVRKSLENLEHETRAQLIGWLQSLGARALESVVRMYLQGEGYSLLAALPPGRGLGRLVVEDAESDEEEGRTLVLIVPRKTALDPKLWEGELDRNNCQQLVAVAMGDAPEDGLLADARLIVAAELAAWLVEHGIGVQKIQLDATVLDATFIESIGGLDT